MNTAKRQIASQWLQIILGIFMCVLAYRMYLIPNEIAPGGFTGIGQLVNSLTGWPVGTIALFLNIPLFLLSLRSLGFQFGLKSLFATISLSILIDYLPIPAVTDNQLLACVYGGVLGGIGFGFILRGGATTGGSDMLGKLISVKISWMRVSIIIFTVDALVILASGFVFDATSAMYALISAFLMSRLLDQVLEGLNAAKAYFIISAQSGLIAERIMNEMGRGVTGINGKGMFSGKDTQVLLCVINRLETVQLKSIVAQCDPSAFVIATDVHEALGEGFRPHK